MPGILDQDEKNQFIRTIQRLDMERRSGVFRDELPPLPEGIKRSDKGTKEYSSYLEEIMNELQHIKKEYGSRKKANYKYRKEASKIQDAYSEIKRLKKMNDRKFQEDQMLSERLVRVATGHDHYEDKDKEFNRDSIRDFFDKFK
mgnify:CR=1 FL=1